MVAPVIAQVRHMPAARTSETAQKTPVNEFSLKSNEVISTFNTRYDKEECSVNSPPRELIQENITDYPTSQKQPVESKIESTQANDKRMYEIAAAAASSIHWDDLDLELAAISRDTKYKSAWKRKKLSRTYQNSNALTIFTRNTIRDHRHQTRWGPKGFAVLAEGTLPCTVQELRLVFRTTSTDTFRNIMHCVYRHEFQDGEQLQTSKMEHETGTLTRAFDDQDLSIKTAVFRNRRCFSKKQPWCYLELLQPQDRRNNLQSITQTTSSIESANSAFLVPAFTRTLVSIPRSKVDQTTSTSIRLSASQHVPNVVINYSFEEDPSGRSTRVIIHGEYLPPGLHNVHKRTNHERRIARLWMLRLAANCHRFLLIARRRRLGMQVVLRNSSLHVQKVAHLLDCACCHRSFATFIVHRKKKLCCLCGFLVCEKCAHAQEREHLSPTTTGFQIEHVQVCERCLIRVDQAQYNAITEEDLRPARVISDAQSPASSTCSNSVRGRYTQPTVKIRSASLNNLLQEILGDTTTDDDAQQKRRSCVLSVMKDIVVKERTRGQSSAARASSSSVVAAKSNFFLIGEDDDEALDDITERHVTTRYQQTRKSIPLRVNDYPLANADSRTYQMEFPDDPKQAGMPELPINEYERLRLIREQQLHDLGDVPELDIICSLASKELQCTASMITVVNEAKLHVLASNHPAVPGGVSFPREQSFCAHTILDTQPLVSRHVQADVRFSAITSVQEMGIKFYCGFPLMGSDGETVIGAVCCVDQQAHDLTQSQYDTMSSLASTASRVVRRASERRAIP
ncbi:hypothetical protein CCR75_005213 [Bremia lactucae]|uniref:FYVE-type domain-containing protein n=1 Tax=Bremia lactucae TaxID=4779 RepID=A0A976FG00_BRELC|nr:hypothetical protein CCR75_005213 [Bremia lactucae]